MSKSTTELADEITEWAAETAFRIVEQQLKDNAVFERDPKEAKRRNLEKRSPTNTAHLVRNSIRQALSRPNKFAPCAALIEWKPIDENTPRDGKRILLAKIVGHPDHPTALWWVTRGFWSEKYNNWNDGIEPAGLADPTHWMAADAHGCGDGALLTRLEASEPDL